jgi:hypothetical protein
VTAVQAGDMVVCTSDHPGMGYGWVCPFAKEPQHVSSVSADGTVALTRSWAFIMPGKARVVHRRHPAGVAPLRIRSEMAMSALTRRPFRRWVLEVREGDGYLKAHGALSYAGAVAQIDTTLKQLARKARRS